jgi:polyphenol oxidase
MNANWYELKHQGAWSYICYPLLETAGIFHGFVTRPRDASCEEGGIEGAISAFSLEPHVLMNQEHGDAVHVIRDGERPSAGDGLLLLEKNVAGIIKTADCLPVLLYSLAVPVVAILHAGWKGTALGIVRKAARQMAVMGLKPESMGALIGPGIGPCCYEVQEDVAGIFNKAAGFGDPVIQRREGSSFLDLKAANIQMLREEGLREIHDVGLCTFCREDLFYSARRDKGRGRQINFVLIRG